MDISKDNKGASLVELVIALMITAIVISMLLFFLNSASKGFKLTNDDVNLQMEAQTIINQISNLVMEAEYMEYEDGEEVKAHMIRHIDSESNTRYIFKLNDTQNRYYGIILSEGNIYQIISDNILDVKEEKLDKQKHLLAEYVDKFDIIRSETDKEANNGNPSNKSVDIVLELSLGNDRTKLSKRVKFRNAR